MLNERHASANDPAPVLPSSANVPGLMACRGVVVKLPLVEAGVGAFYCPGADMGRRVLWEQKSFLQLCVGTDVKLNLGEARKSEKKAMFIENILEEWGLDEDNFDVGDSKTRGSTRWTRMTTDFLVPWLLKKFRASLVGPQSSRKFAAPTARTWMALMAAAEAGGATSDPEIDLVEMENGMVVEVKLTSTSVDVGELMAVDPRIEPAWGHVRRQWPQHITSTLPHPSPSSWILFLYLWPRQNLATIAPWREGHLGAAASMVSGFLENWVRTRCDAADVEGWWAPLNSLLEIRTRSGRRGTVDPMWFHQLKVKQKKIKGSGTTVAEAMHGSKTHMERTLMLTTNKLYLDGISRLVLSGPLDFSFNFDPGSYSGHSYNQGILYSWRNDASAVVAPKALGIENLCAAGKADLFAQ